MDNNDEDISIAEERVVKITTEIGSKVAQDPTIFNLLLPELVSTNSQRLYNFGIGLAEGCADKIKLWVALRTQFEKTIDEKKSLQIFLGFVSICAEIDPIFYHSTLNDLIIDPILGKWFPFFQNVVTIDKQGLSRLHIALESGIVHIHSFRCIAYGKSHEALSDDELAELLEKILSKDNGMVVAIEILFMRFHGSNNSAFEFSSNLIEIGRKMIVNFEFPTEHGSRNDRLDHELAKIATLCLDDECGENAAKEVCKHLLEAIKFNRIYAFGYPELLNSIARVQPLVFLDSFLVSDKHKDYHRRRMIYDGFERRRNPLNSISHDDFLQWGDNDPVNRYPLIATSIQTFSDTGDGKITWNPIVRHILKNAPDIKSVLENLEGTIYSGSGSRSRVVLFEMRSMLFQELFEHENSEIKAWAKKHYSKLKEEIEFEREREAGRDIVRYESFE